MKELWSIIFSKYVNILLVTFRNVLEYLKPGNAKFKNYMEFQLNVDRIETWYPRLSENWNMINIILKMDFKTTTKIRKIN